MPCHFPSWARTRCSFAAWFEQIPPGHVLLRWDEHKFIQSLQRWRRQGARLGRRLDVHNFSHNLIYLIVSSQFLEKFFDLAAFRCSNLFNLYVFSLCSKNLIRSARKKRVVLQMMWTAATDCVIALASTTATWTPHPFAPVMMLEQKLKHSCRAWASWIIMNQKPSVTNCYCFVHTSGANGSSYTHTAGTDSIIWIHLDSAFGISQVVGNSRCGIP